MLQTNEEKRMEELVNTDWMPPTSSVMKRWLFCVCYSETIILRGCLFFRNHYPWEVGKKGVWGVRAEVQTFKKMKTTTKKHLHLSFARNLGHLVLLIALSFPTSVCSIFMCPTVVWLPVFGIFTCTQMLVHVIAHGGCENTA